MQEKDIKAEKFAIVLGEILRELRSARNSSTINKLANEYELNKGTLSKLERGNNNCQFITLWKLSEALGIRCSDLVKLLEERLGEEFTLLDE